MEIISAIFDAVVKGLMAFFLPSKDEKLGQLEVTDKVQKNALDEIQKSKTARESLDSDPATAERVRGEYTRKN